jgi:hypothetical protein
MTRVRYLLSLLSILGAFSLAPLQAQQPSTSPNSAPEVAPALPSGTSEGATSPIAPVQPVDTPTQPVEAADQRAEKIDTLFGVLEGHLRQQNWQAADQDTFKLMLVIAGPRSEDEGRFVLDEWASFPCDELKRVDLLWSQYSDGKLGFSAQKKVFDTALKDFPRFYRRVGWYDQLTGTWKVSWNYDAQRKMTSYTETGLFAESFNPLQVEGSLPAILAWDDEREHRFQMINTCKLESPS